MIWKDLISTVVDCINAQSFFNAARTTTPSNLALVVYNQSQDWLCMNRAWRDLIVTTQLTLDNDNKITMPDDFGMCLYVYDDPTQNNLPANYYYRGHPDPGKRYTEEVTRDTDTGINTIKFCFFESAVMGNPYVVYSKTIENATQAEYDASTKYSFFPMNIMLAVAKMILCRYYGKSGNQDINQVMMFVNQELKLLSAYCIENNAPLDLVVHDGSGRPVYIDGPSLDGSGFKGQRSIYPNSTLLMR